MPVEPRHAQRHWLTIQAQAAIDMAMESPSDLDLAWCDSHHAEEPHEGRKVVGDRIRIRREKALAEASDKLEEAERYHRILCRFYGGLNA